MQDFRAGLQLLNDDTTSTPGSARQMTNVLITDRGGISPRPGTVLLGAKNTSVKHSKSFFVFRKSNGQLEIPIKTYDDEVEAYDSVFGWYRLKNNFTIDQEFGFLSNLNNVDNEDFAYFCNRYEPFQRWSAAIAHITTPLVGAETTITVDSTLIPDVYERDTSTASGATTVDQTAITWANNQWRNFYVYFTSGAQSGQVRKITSNTANQLVFDTLAGAPGTGVTFEIRMTKFRSEFGWDFIYNGTKITVTAIPSATQLTVASAHAAPTGTPITVVPQEFVEAPRGNRIESLIGRTMIGNVRSAMARDSGGTVQGWSAAGSVFIAKLNDPKAFTFSASRVAGEGDLLSFPYGGGDIVDVAVQEQVAYVYKKRYVEAIQYSQDTADRSIRTPIKSGVGSIGRVIKGKDDHYFITEDKQFTSVGRVLQKDATVQTENIGLPIKRLLDTYDFRSVNGIEFRNRIFFSCRSESTIEENNATLVWNKTTRSFEGAWSIGASGFDIYQDELYFAESTGANVWKMFEGASDDDGTTRLPISSTWQSNFFNLLPVKGNTQGVVSIALEGYINAGTTFTTKLFKEFSSTSSIEFTFGGLTSDDFLLGDDLAAFLGANPLGLEPIGTIESPGADGRRRFSFLVYFPYLYGQHFSIGFSSSGVDQDWEIIRATLGLSESISTIRSGIKPI